MSSGRSLRVALPGLRAAALRLEQCGGAARLPAAEWLVSRGQRTALPGPDWRSWLLAGAGLGADVLARHPVGPCSAPRRGGHSMPGTWARAEPVHLLTGLDHLQLAAPAPLPLAAEESTGLRATLDDHLVGSGFRLHDGGHGGWVVECPPGCDFTALEPVMAVRRNLRECLPTGRDAARIRALGNELQMLLHEHPVNERRAARGLPAVNSTWLWGVGAVTEPQGTAAGCLFADDAWLVGVWRLHGGRCDALDALPQVLAEPSGDLRIAVTAGLDTAGDLAALDAALFEQVRAALLAGRLQEVTVYADGLAIRVTGAARWAFWRRSRPLSEALA
jgi:hypothetical protein